MNEAVRNDTVEGRSDLKVGLELLLRLHSRLCSPDHLLFKRYKRVRSFHLLLRLYQFVAGDCSGRLGRSLTGDLGQLVADLGNG